MEKPRPEDIERMMAEEAARLRPEERKTGGVSAGDSDSSKSGIGGLIQETLDESGVAGRQEASMAGDLSEEIRISPAEQLEYDLKVKPVESADVQPAASKSWHEGDQGEFEARLAEVSEKAPDVRKEPAIEVDDDAMRHVREKRVREEEAKAYVSQKEAYERGEVTLDAASNSVLRTMAASVAGPDADPKRLEDLVIQSRGMMQMHLRDNGPSQMSKEQALDRVRSFMTKLWGGQAESDGRSESGRDIAGSVAVRVGSLRRLPENQQGSQIRAMLEATAREIMGDDADPKKITALADNYDGLMRTFLKMDQMSDNEIAAQLSRQMQQKADVYLGRKAS